MVSIFFFFKFFILRLIIILKHLTFHYIILIYYKAIFIIRITLLIVIINTLRDYDSVQRCIHCCSRTNKSLKWNKNKIYICGVYIKATDGERYKSFCRDPARNINGKFHKSLDHIIEAIFIIYLRSLYP